VTFAALSKVNEDVVRVIAVSAWTARSEDMPASQQRGHDVLLAQLAAICRPTPPNAVPFWGSPCHR
jgi:hypothetical protein